MINTMGIIYTTKDDLTLREMTASRAVAALPVAGRYRMIDFVLSNMVNSGVRNVGVIMQKNYHSLMDHLGSGKEWDLHTRNDGLRILPPFLTRENVGEYSGNIDALRSNAGFLRRSRQEYVILSASHTVFNTTYYDMLAEHIRSNADITMMYVKARPSDIDYSVASNESHAFADIDETGRVLEIEVNPNVASYPNYLMDVIIVKRTLLLHLVDQAYSHGMHDMNCDLLRRYVQAGLLRVQGYEFKGYHRRIETVKSYFGFNMDVINSDVRQELFKKNPVYTKVRDEVPARYYPGAKVENSLVADGCEIAGTVENSVLFRGVKIARGAIVRNSIIMQDGEVQESCELENVIFDKAVTIRSYGRLIGQRQYPIVIGQNVFV